MFSNYFDALILKIIFKNKKNYTCFFVTHKLQLQYLPNT